MALEVNKKIGIPAVKFDPEFFKRSYKEFRLGRYANVIEMINRSETDSWVSGCLLGRRAGFQKRMSVLPFNDSDEDQKKAEWLDTVLKGLNIRQLFKDIHEAILKKYSVIDFDWELVDRLLVPIKHRKVEQRFFRYNDDGELRIDFGRNDLREIPTEDVLVCEIDGMPVMLPVLRDFILKEFGLSTWARFMEKLGEALIIGTYPAGAGDDFKDALQDAVDNIASSTTGIMPEGSKIELKETNRSTGDHQDFKSEADKGISVALLGHANAVEQSKGLQVGENLTSFRVKQEIAIDDIYFIEAQMNRLVRIIWRPNYPDTNYPTIEIDKKDPLTLQQRLDLIDMAYRHGVRISPDEYREAGLYIYPDQDPIEKPPSLLNF